MFCSITITYTKDLNASYYISQINYLEFLVLVFVNNFYILINSFKN